MLLTITLTTAPATDLGYLLHKSPSRGQYRHVGLTFNWSYQTVQTQIPVVILEIRA